MELEEQIKSIIEEKVEDMLTSNLIEKCVADVVEKAFDYDLKKQLENAYLKNFERITKDYIEEFVNKPVVVDDFYSKKEYKTFDEFVKSELQKRIKDSFDLRRTIENQVSSRVNNIIQEIIKDKPEILLNAFQQLITSVVVKK